MKKINFFSVIMALFVISLCCGTASYGQDYGDNLITNGDFSDGNTGFTTDYFFITPENAGSNSLVPEGVYLIGTNPGAYHNNFVDMPDNDNPFMIVNGHTDETMEDQGVPNNPAIVWQQEIADVEVDKDYEFSFDLLSLVTSNPAHLEITIYIDGEEMKSIIVGEDQTENWVNFVYTKTEEEKSNGTVITIAETSQVESGNDFGLDNIMFREILPQYTPILKVSPVLECVTNNGDGEYTALFGYNNQNEFEVEIPQGPNNRISSNTALDGSDELPEVFLPGRQVGVFEIVFNGDDLVWHLKSPDTPAATSTASANSQRCPCEDELELTVEGEMEVCAGEYGSLLVDVMGGIGPYSFVWEDGVEGAERTDLPAGEYTVTVMDDNGCEVTETFAVAEFPEMEVDITSTPVTCNGDEDGTIVVEMNGAKPFNICISYGCEPGDEEFVPVKTQTATYEGLMPGNYLITVVDANGCEYTECVTVGEPDPITAEVDFEPILCNGESTEVTVTGFGGNPPYTLFNQEGEEVETFDFDYTLEVFAGEYEWTLSDAEGCEAFVIDFEVEEPPVLEATYEATEILCNGDLSTVTVFATGGTAPYTLFDGETEAGELVDGEFSLDVPADTYNWTVVDANGCELDIEVTITQPDALEASYEKDEILCFGEQADVTVFAEGGIAPYELFDGEVKAGDLVDGEITLSVGVGSYNWTVVDANGCEADVNFDMDEPAPLEATYEATEILCNGELSTVTVFATGGTAPYTLFDGETEAGELVDGEFSLDVPADTYNWTVVDANGCSVDIEEIIITEPPLLVAELVSTEEASCYGAVDGEAVISVTGGTPSYTFDMDGVFAEGLFTISDLAADTYTVTITDSKNCGPEEVTFTIEEPEELVIEDVVVTVPDCAPDNFPGCEEPWAVAVIDDMTIEGYSTYGDGTVNANRRVIENVLGMPDESNAPPITYVSLGYEGQLVLEAGCEIVNAEGNDFEVIETSYGSPSCDNHPEKADVWVAQTLDGPWSYLGETCLSGEFDLENGETAKEGGEEFILDWARYVKVVDATNPDDFSNGDGFDLNGINIFNTSVAPAAPVAAELEIIISPEVEGAVYTVLNEEDEEVDINNITESGDYTIFFEFDGCVSNEFDFEVEFPEPIAVDATVTDVSCFEGADGTAEINISGGTPEYTIIFEGEEIEGNIIAGLAAGSYEAVIVDAKGCVETVQFDVDEPTQLVVGQTNGEILCYEGTTWVSLDIQGGTAPYVLTDDNSDFELIVDEAGLLELDPIFTYGQYNWTVTDANGCYVTVEFFLEQPAELVAVESYDAIACFGGTTDVTVTATGGEGLYSLYDGVVSEETLVVAEFTDFTIVPDRIAGVYNWIVVDGNGCETPVAFDLEQPDEFTADFELDPEQILCHNGLTDVIVTGNGGTEPYLLNLGDGNVIEFYGGSYTVNEIAPGMAYSWTVTDANECVEIPIEFEIENPDPIVVVSVDTEDILCHDGDNGYIDIVADGGTGALTYALDGGEAQDNGYFENLTAGDYDITIMDANGCFIVETVTLTEPDELVVDLAISHATGMDENDGEIEGMISGGVGPYNVCLFTECEFNEDEANEDYDKSQGFLHFGLEPGSYQVVVTDQNGCQWIECVEIGIEEDLQVNLVSQKDEDPLSDGNFMETEAEVSVYPNPFTTRATIEFTLTENSDVTLEIYNLVGERVAILYNGQVNAFESQKHTFNAESLPNGIYIYKLTAGEKVFHDRIVLTR